MASVLLTSNLEVSLMFSSIFCALKKNPKNMFISFREREEGRERNDVRETSADGLLYPPIGGQNPKPRYVPCRGIAPAAFRCTGRCSNRDTWPALFFCFS